MLTGMLPFEGRTQQEMMIARLRNDPIPLRKRRDGMGFPEAMEAVLLKGMARSPDERYASAPEFAEALRASAGGSASGDGVIGKLFGR
jgi:serine/threonine-protein kinase